MTGALGLTLPDVETSVHLHSHLGTTIVMSVVPQAKIASLPATRPAAIVVTTRTQFRLQALAVIVPPEAITRARLAVVVVNSLNLRHRVHLQQTPTMAG